MWLCVCADETGMHTAGKQAFIVEVREEICFLWELQAASAPENQQF